MKNFPENNSRENQNRHLMFINFVIKIVLFMRYCQIF